MCLLWLDHSGAVTGLLDITQCMKESLHRLEKADKMARRLASALDHAEDAETEASGDFSSDTSTSKPDSAFHRQQAHLTTMLLSIDWPMSQASVFAEILKNKLAAPTISTLLLSRSKAPPLLSYKCTVMDATRLMRQSRETAVLLVDDNKSGALVGIFTSKDVVLRVLAVMISLPTPLMRLAIRTF